MRGKEDSGVKRHVSIFVFLSVGLCLLFCMGIVSATPSIVAWSSSGGNSTYKDNPQDLIYKVQPGDTITFTVTTNETCNFTWKVMLGAEVLQTYEEDNTKTSSFTWTVPNEISTWDIEVEASNYKPALGPYEQDHKIWTITTSQLIELSPGEDIQSAIDSLPVEGGVVELKEGTWHLNNAMTPIVIDRSGITLRGQGKNKTALSLTEHISHGLIRISVYRDDQAFEDATKPEPNSCGALEPQADELCNISNVVIEGIHLHGFDRKFSSHFDNLAIEGLLFKNAKFSDLWIDNFGEGFKLWKSVNSTFQYSLMEHTGGPFWDFGPFCGYTLRHNIFRNGGNGYVIKYNGACDHNIFTNNIIEHVNGWALQPYGISSYNTITNNLIRYPSGHGIWMWGFSNLVKGNIIHDCGLDGIRIRDSYAFHDPSMNINNVTNNLIYNNEGSGIATQVESTSEYATRTANIINNVIYGNEKDGITCDGLLNGVPVYAYNIKNNIIINNKGYGINYIGGESINLSYNDVYNNSLGNYNGISPGDGDISANPLFADPENEDFHLKSEYGRWNPNQKQWVYDSETSPCIDAGDPTDDYSNEPDYPNGRINLGAYGNTEEASFGSSLSTGTLKGKVTDKDTGSPIEGALIEANSHQTTTNSTGDYILSLPVGNYTVTASKEGYYLSTATAEILANQTTTLNFQLTKDTTPPVIYNITVSSITSHSAVISWKTNESSTSLVKYGTSPGSYPYSKEDASYITSHIITLTGLSPNTTYYFVVNSTDKANNSAQSTEQSFKTKELSNIVYVARDGTGDYNCDGEDDQIEINQAIAYINSIGGGIVHLKNGTFVISDSINLSSNLILEGEGAEKTIIKIEDGSTKENWATIVGDGISNTIIKNLTIDGNKDNCPVPNGINSDVNAINLYNSNNLTVENVKMIDFWTDGVMFIHSSNSVVKDCEVIQAGHEGLRAIYSDNITFSNNYVYSARTGNAGIRIYESSNCIVERNYFNVYGFGILINPQGGVPCGNNIYRDNYIKGHYGLPGIALWPWDTEVSNETFIRNIIAKTDGTQEPYGHGIHLRTRGTASLKNIKIINNVINNAIKSGIYVEDGADVSNIVAKNNIIVNNGGYGIYGNVLSSYNDVWNNNAGNYGGGASAGKGDISADPLFASPPHDFHLKSQAGRWNGSAWVVDNVTSPCIDAGVPFEEDPVYGDYRNELPPNGSRINMGAYGNTKEASKSAGKTYSISGYVKYENGTGIFNAHVTNNRTSVEDYTDENGYYILHGLTNGTYLITASKTGSLSNSIVVTIAGKDVENANITLAEDASPPLIFFTSPTTDHTTENWVYVNVTVIDESPTSSFINWNNTLAAYWSFNTVNETKWTPDFSEHHNHGRLGDGSTTEMPVLTEGKFGHALKFDGVDDFIRVPDSPSLDGFDDGEITIEAWIKPVLGSRGSIVNKYLYNRTIPINERVYELDVKSDGRIGFALSSNGTYAGTVWLTSEMKVKNNTWTHIAAVSDGKTMKIFINGVQDANTAQAPPRIHDSPYPLYIGRWQWSPTDWDCPFKGVIDELRIWNRALSPEEINASFASGALRHNFTDLKDGRYAYYAYAIDTAGNYNRTETKYITVNTEGGGEPPHIISFAPSDLTPTQYVNRTYTFSVTVSQPVSNAWFLDGEDQHNNAQSWTHTWEHTGMHNVTYIGTNENGTVSLTWTVNVTTLPSPNETLVYISPSSKVVKRGASFNISIYVEPGEEIAGMQANLIFDPSFVHVNSVAEGDLLRNSGLPTFFIPGKINNTAGFVKDIACTILGKGNVSSPGTFAIINMTAGNLSGTSPLKIEGVKVTNSYAQLLPHNISNGTLIVNDPPVLTPIGDKTVYEGSLLEFTVSAYDPDNDTLSFTASNLPRGASFDPETRKFSWTPDYEQAGSYKVHFEVSDGYYNDSEDITITVINVNRPPKITYFVPENGSVFNESDIITIKVIASDPDNDNIYYEIKIDNVTVSTNSSYTWETNYSSAGEHKITACVSDGYAEVSETHTIIINDVDPRWDVNEDCVVDVRDLTIVGQHFGEEFISPPYPRYDVNADGVVDVSDTTIVGQHFGEMTCI